MGSPVILIFGCFPAESIWRATKGFSSFGMMHEGVEPILLGGFATYSAAGEIFNISVSNWFRDKGYGMGKLVGYIPGFIRGLPSGLQRIT